jgi:hypothetical protein
MAHDFFIRYAVAVGRGYKTGTQTVRADRLRERAFETGPIPLLRVRIGHVRQEICEG